MSTDTDTIEKVKVELKKPKKWVIVLHNDDITPIDFVIELLYYIFKMDAERATTLTIKIHTEGKGVAGIYPYEIAEQKHAEAQALVKLSNMSLKITLEEE